MLYASLLYLSVLLAAPQLEAAELLALPEEAPLSVGQVEQLAGGPRQVELELTISAAGEVEGARVRASGGRDFDALAMEIFVQAQFQPARRDGVAIRSRVRVIHVFQPPPVEQLAFEPVEIELPDDIEVSDEPLETQPERHELEEAVVVEAEWVAPGETEGLALGSAAAEHVAGNQGELLRSAQALGGVARPALGDRGMAIWGADPGESQYFVEWIPVPTLFHVGGRRSLFPPELLAGVRLQPAGYGPGKGRALGGLVELTIEEGGEASSRTDLPPLDWGVGVDPLDLRGHFALDGPRGQRLVVAVRRSLQKQLFDRLWPGYSETLLPVGDYTDYQLYARLGPGANAWKLLAFASHDRLGQGLPSQGALRPFEQTTRDDLLRVGLSRTWQTHSAAKAFVETWLGYERHSEDSRFVSSTVDERQRRWAGGLRVGESRALTGFWGLDYGLDLQVDHVAWQRRGALSLPAREGDINFLGQPPSARINDDAWRQWHISTALFMTSPLTWARWTLEPGIRLGLDVRVVDRKLPVRPIEPEIGLHRLLGSVGPRLRLTWRPHSVIALGLSAGRYHQAPQARDASPIFGNPNLEMASAWHLVARASFQIGRWLDLKLQGFATRLGQLAVRSSHPTPALAEALVSTGEGRSLGLQVNLESGDWGPFSGRVSYTWMRAQRRAGTGANWRAFDRDQPHTLHANLAWQHCSGLQLAVGLAWYRGQPYTAITDRIFDARNGRFDPIFGAHNAARFPDHFELSARVAWQRRWRAGLTKVWVDVVNVSNRANVSDYLYNEALTDQIPVRGLPIFPVLGLEHRR